MPFGYEQLIDFSSQTKMFEAEYENAKQVSNQLVAIVSTDETKPQAPVREKLSQTTSYVLLFEPCDLLKVPICPNER